VTAAENAWGSGTGAAKLDTVRMQILALLPESVRAIVPTDWLTNAIEAGLEAAKKRWGKSSSEKD
jgi:hypothetical protein